MKSKLFFGFMALLLIAVIPLTLVALKNRQDTRSRASTSAVQFYFTSEPNSTVVAGTEFELPLRMNTNGNSVAAIDITIIFDKNKMEMTGVNDANSEFGPNIQSNTPNNTTGQLRYTATVKDNNPITDSEVDIAILKFKPKPLQDSNSNTSQVSFSNLNVATSGQANNSLSFTFQPVNFTISQNIASDSKPLLCQYYGDINEDNVLSASDVALMTTMASSRGTFTLDQKSNSDLNNDGIINQLDINILQSYLVGSSTTFPICAGGPVCTNPNSFSPTVLGCEQCLACGSLTWCENMLQGNVGGPRMSGCVYTASNCTSRAGTARTTCPSQLTNDPVCISLTPTLTNGSAPLTVGFTGVGKNDFGTIYRMKIDWGDGTPGTDMSYGGVIGNTVTKQFDPHTYNSPGTYTAKLTVYGNDNSKTATNPACEATITVRAIPTRTPTPTPTITTNPTPTGIQIDCGGDLNCMCYQHAECDSGFCLKDGLDDPNSLSAGTCKELKCDNKKDKILNTEDYNVWLTEFKSGTGNESDCDGQSGVTIFDYAQWLGEFRKYVLSN